MCVCVCALALRFCGCRCWLLLMCFYFLFSFWRSALHVKKEKRGQQGRLCRETHGTGEGRRELLRLSFFFFSWAWVVEEDLRRGAKEGGRGCGQRRAEGREVLFVVLFCLCSSCLCLGLFFFVAQQQTKKKKRGPMALE